MTELNLKAPHIRLCPFCGKPATICKDNEENLPENLRGKPYYISHPNCPVINHTLWFASEKEALEAWNHRDYSYLQPSWYHDEDDPENGSSDWDDLRNDYGVVEVVKVFELPSKYNFYVAERWKNDSWEKEKFDSFEEAEKWKSEGDE